MNKILISFCLKLFFIAVLIPAAASGKKDSIDENPYSLILQAENSNKAHTHRWFYFTDSGFKETSLPRKTPVIQRKPWTESIRITSAVLIDGTAFFTVNKLGMLVCPSASGPQSKGIASETKLIKNTALFLPATAGELFCIDKFPVFNMYTNSIFENKTGLTENRSEQADSVASAKRPLLAQFIPENWGFIPLVFLDTFKKSAADAKTQAGSSVSFAAAELRELHFDGENWFSLFKHTDTQRTEFFALSFYSIEPLTSLAVSKLPPELIIKDMSIYDYQEKNRPIPFFQAPRRIKDLLAPLSPQVSFYLNHRAENAAAIQHFVQGSETANTLQAYSLSLESCSIAVFEDGTVCFAGMLPAKHVLAGGKTIAFKLPRLPRGQVYGPISLAGSTLFAAWEETSFFETGRSGFIAVDLERVLYPMPTD